MYPKTLEIEVSHREMPIIKHYLDSGQVQHDAYRVGWEGSGLPAGKQTPIAIRIGRSSEEGTLYTGDLRPTRYIDVPHDQDFHLVRERTCIIDAKKPDAQNWDSDLLGNESYSRSEAQSNIARLKNDAEYTGWEFRLLVDSGDGNYQPE